MVDNLKIIWEYKPVDFVEKRYEFERPDYMIVFEGGKAVGYVSGDLYDSGGVTPEQIRNDRRSMLISLP